MSAPTEYYVDPATGNDTTGNGTSGTPWASVGHALDVITRDTVNGDAINLADTAADVLSSALNATTLYGAASALAPLIIRGWDRGNGGVGEMSGGGSVAIFSDIRGAVLYNLKLHNCGSAAIVTCPADCVFVACEITNTSGNGIVISGGDNSRVIACNIHDIGGVGITTRSATVSSCYLKNGTKSFTKAISCNGPARIQRNIISLSGSSVGIEIISSGIEVVNNSIRGGGGTGKGIDMSSAARYCSELRNNIVAGFSGTGGIGFAISGNCEITLYGSNAAYNNTTNYSTGSDVAIDRGDNEELASNPVAESGSDTFANRMTYFSPVDTGNVHGGANG